MTEVAIARASLHFQGIPAPSGSPHALVRAVMEALERELDAALGAVPEVIVIPRIDIDIRLDAAGAASLADAVARRLAAQIAIAVRRERAAGHVDAVPASATRSGAISRNEPHLRELLEAARAVVEGAPASAMAGEVRAAAARSDAEAPEKRAAEEREGAAWARAITTAADEAIFAILGRAARRKQLRAVVEALGADATGTVDTPAARALLSQVHAFLSRTLAGKRATHAARTEAAATLRAAAGRAKQRWMQEGSWANGHAVEEIAMAPALSLLLAIAEESRLVQDRIARAPALAAAVIEAIAELGIARRVATANAVPEVDAAQEREPTTSTLAAEDEPQRAVPQVRDALLHLYRGPIERDAVSDLENDSPAAREMTEPDPISAPSSPIPDSSAANASFDESFLAEDPELRIASSAAGLAFLVQPLLDLGWAEALDAIRDEPTLMLASIFRRILALEGAPDEVLDDPAIWILAGLLDAPSEEELAADADTWSAEACAALARAAGAEATTAEGACDAWARAIVAEARMRLEGTTGAKELGADVILATGAIVAAEERVEIVLPFIDAYEALLRAGLLADVAWVPWLGRPLRFVFEGPEQGGTP